MAKTCSTTIWAAALAEITANVSRICVCKGEPPTATAAESSVANCIATTTCSELGGSLTLADSSLTGKKIDVSAFTAIPAISTGVADTIVLTSSGATGRIYWQTTCATQVVSSTGNVVNTGAFIIRISDAT